MLRAMPEIPEHPLARFIHARGLTLQDAAPYLEMTPRNLTDICRRWRRPRMAVWIARELGFASVDDLFPQRS